MNSCSIDHAEICPTIDVKITSLTTKRTRRSGFTLIELLIVIAIIAVLACIALPVFSAARERGRLTSCESNMRQIGLACLQYEQDNDETAPGSNQVGITANPGQGWASQVYPYFVGAAGTASVSGATGILQCPDDPTVPNAGFVVDSYGYNVDMIATDTSAKATLIPVCKYNSPAKSVMIFEIEGGVSASPRLSPDTANNEGSISGDGQNLFGGDNYYVRYATGLLGEIPQATSNTLCAFWWTGNTCPSAINQPNGKKGVAPHFYAPLNGRHTGGANYCMADGHVKWIVGSQVSVYGNADYSYCNQYNVPKITGCRPGNPNSAGTEGTANGKVPAATFSVI